MRIIARSTLVTFWGAHRDAEQPMRAWFHEVKAASWANPHEIKSHYRSASILKNGRVVFNIGGNKFRIVVAIAFQTQVIFIKFVGTHAQYDQIDALTIES